MSHRYKDFLKCLKKFLFQPPRLNINDAERFVNTVDVDNIARVRLGFTHGKDVLCIVEEKSGQITHLDGDGDKSVYWWMYLNAKKAGENIPNYLLSDCSQ